MLFAEDLAHRSLEEVVALQNENHSSSQAIRIRIRTMVDKRLAKVISADQYALERGIAEKEKNDSHLVHCLLSAEILRRRSKQSTSSRSAERKLQTVNS